MQSIIPSYAPASASTHSVSAVSHRFHDSGVNMLASMASEHSRFPAAAAELITAPAPAPQAPNLGEPKEKPFWYCKHTCGGCLESAEPGAKLVPPRKLYTCVGPHMVCAKLHPLCNKNCPYFSKLKITRSAVEARTGHPASLGEPLKKAGWPKRCMHTCGCHHTHKLKSQTPVVGMLIYSRLKSHVQARTCHPACNRSCPGFNKLLDQRSPSPTISSSSESSSSESEEEEASDEEEKEAEWNNYTLHEIRAWARCYAFLEEDADNRKIGKSQLIRIMIRGRIPLPGHEGEVSMKEFMRTLTKKSDEDMEREQQHALTRTQWNQKRSAEEAQLDEPAKRPKSPPPAAAASSSAAAAPIADPIADPKPAAVLSPPPPPVAPQAVAAAAAAPSLPPLEIGQVKLNIPLGCSAAAFNEWLELAAHVRAHQPK